MQDSFAWDKYFIDSIFEHVNVWINAYDKDMNLVMWNPMAEITSGYSREEVVGNSKIWDWLYPDEAYRAKIVGIASDVIYGIQPDIFESDILCKDQKTIKTIAWNTQAIYDADKKFLGVVTFGYDVTERKQTQEALTKANDELSILYNIASVTSSVLDLNTILEQVLKDVLTAMGSEKGIIHLWDDEHQELKLRIHSGFSEASLSDIQSISNDSGVIGRVYNTNRPIAVSNFLELLDDAPKQLPSRLFNSYLGVPINAKRHHFGVFSVLGRADKEFHQDDINLLSLIADQTGVAIENARLYERAQKLAVSEERRRLARDLHDAVTQSVYSLTLFAEAGQRALNSGDLEDTASYLEDMGKTAQSALREMRVLLHELRPLDLENEGLIEAIQNRLEAVERRVGIKAHLHSDVTAELPSHLEKELYRIVQEALNNTLHHASAEKVSVRLQQTGEQLVVKISDDGVGYDLTTHESKGRMGLETMHERCQRLGGEFEIVTAPGEGFEVNVTVNVGDKKDD